MNRIVDALLINILVILFTLCWVSVITDKLIIVIIVTLLVWIVSLFVIFYLNFNRKRRKKPSLAECQEAFALMGSTKTAEWIFSAIPPSYKPKLVDDFIQIIRFEKEILLYPSFGFSPPSHSEIAKCYRKARELGFQEVAIIGKTPSSRGVYLFAGKLDVHFTFYSAIKTYRFLAAANSLPPTISVKKTKKSISLRPSIADTLSLIFIRKRSKLFLLSGLILTVFSMLTPLKIYYLVSAGISMIFCALCFILNR